VILEDERIVELFFDRSEEAVAALLEKYGAQCRKMAGNILGDARDAEECVNEAYLGVWNTIPPKRPKSLSAYLLKKDAFLLGERWRMRFWPGSLQGCSMDL
jgi:DNA-directed RNA polymerase specialized sigma24 family protein